MSDYCESVELERAKRVDTLDEAVAIQNQWRRDGWVDAERERVQDTDESPITYEVKAKRDYCTCVCQACGHRNQPPREGVEDPTPKRGRRKRDK